MYVKPFTSLKMQFDLKYWFLKCEVFLQQSEAGDRKTVWTSRAVRKLVGAHYRKDPAFVLYISTFFDFGLCF